MRSLLSRCLWSDLFILRLELDKALASHPPASYHAKYRTHLIQRVLQGDLDFERLMEVMRTDSYLIDAVVPEVCGFGCVAIDSVDQEDDDAHFKCFYPQEGVDVEICKAVTDIGGSCGAFSYALFKFR